MMDDLIRRADTWLAANRRAYYEALRPGTSDAELDAFEKRFNLRLPREFRQLYRWRNGQDPTTFLSFHDNRMFSTLAEIVETKDILDGMIGSDFEEETWWRAAWVPFLSNGAGSHLCLDLAADEGGTPGQLIAFWKADADRPVEYANIVDWFATAVHAMEDGSIDLSEDQ